MYLFPSTLFRRLGIRLEVTPAVGYLLIHAAALMLAWTLLLIWGLLRPIERRGVLLLTVPICIGMGVSALYLIAAKALELEKGLPLLMLPLVLSVLFLGAWASAGKIARAGAKAE
jgi:hypothetical protein